MDQAYTMGRLGISPLIYECYVEKEEYDLYLGDVEKFDEAVLHAQKGIEKILFIILSRLI